MSYLHTLGPSSSSSVSLLHFSRLLRNHWINWNQIWLKSSFGWFSTKVMILFFHQYSTKGTMCQRCILCCCMMSIYFSGKFDGFFFRFATIILVMKYLRDCVWPCNCVYLIGGVMVRLLSLSAVDRVFEPRSGQTKDYKIGICCFSAKHEALRRTSKYWLARSGDNVSEWRDMSIRGLLF